MDERDFDEVDGNNDRELRERDIDEGGRCRICGECGGAHVPDCENGWSKDED